MYIYVYHIFYSIVWDSFHIPIRQEEARQAFEARQAQLEAQRLAAEAAERALEEPMARWARPWFCFTREKVESC